MATEYGGFLKSFMGEDDEEANKDQDYAAWTGANTQEQPEAVEMPENTPNWGNYNPTEQAPAATQAPAQNTSSWDTDGYSTPGYTASSYGAAPSGWDATKWADPNHQTPKYVVGRILVSAGDLKDPANRAKAIADIQKAYPGTTFNGKDTIQVPGIGPVDIFGGAGAGVFSPAWQDLNAEAASAGANGGGQSLLTAYGGNGGGYNWGADSNVQEMMRSNPSMFKTVEDAVGWGKRYYGWTDAGPTGAAPAAPGTPGASAGGNTGPAGIVKPAGSEGSGTPADVDAALQDPKGALMRQIMERMRQEMNVDSKDPIIRGQADAYSAEAERARRDYLGDIAESTSPYASGKMRNEERMTAEKLGQDVGGFEAQLMQRELTARRDEVQKALDSMGGLLTEGERQALQRELAQLDASVRNHATDSQSAQFYAGLSQSDKHFYDQLSQQERLALLDDSFRKQQLGQSDSQFRDTLGFNTADRQTYWDSVRRGLI